ncbi:MFS transporter [Promethearchaeum syntrophicum]|uniref:MFS transporter n=1 Tax=Promethearchaeum syntrophicum TaxID=2594042 RepID=A0A5B9DFX1_9ARCH|nr:MFS transporter [Candidatus Prometheoarchaeum syntrophicum]QEE17945.1 putative sialic acid transporter [Candidatus Prometheoarchaeum syntrophicum]
MEAQQEKNNQTIDEETVKNAPIIKKKSLIKKILSEYKSILLFLPLIIIVSSDDATLIINEVLIVADFQLETQMASFGALLAVSQITKAFSTISFGFFSDKYNRKKLLIIATLAWFTGDIIVSFSTRFWHLFLFRVIASASAGAVSAIALSLLADLFSSEDRGISFAIWGALSLVGVGVGASLCSAFNKVEYDFDINSSNFIGRIQSIRNQNSLEIIRSSWQTPFFFFALIGLVCLILVIFLKEPKRAAKEKILEGILVNEEIDYGKFYSIKLSDLKYIWKRKTTFFLVINFFDVVLSGLLVGSLILWITVDMGFGQLNDTPSKIYLMLFIGPLLIGGIIGMFYWPKKADNMVKKGNKTARVKMAVFLGWAHLPFLLIAFFFIPDASNLTFFNGTIQASPTGFGIGMLAMGIFIGIGMNLELAVGALHYSAMIDVNLPEHRGTMIAAASFIDALGRAIGSWAGLAFVDFMQGTIFEARPVSGAILLSILTFGIGSGLLWLPIYKYADKDMADVSKILEDRKEELERKIK